MNLDLTEEMFDAVLIKVDTDTYDDAGESSNSDLDDDNDSQQIPTENSNKCSETDGATSDDDEDAYPEKVGTDTYGDPGESSNSDLDDVDDSQQIHSSDSNKGSETDGGTSDDSSPEKIPTKRVSFDINAIKLLKSEVRLTPIDISLFQLRKTVNSGSVENHKENVCENLSNGGTLKVDSSIEKLSQVNNVAIRNLPKNSDLPGKTSQKFIIVKKSSETNETITKTFKTDELDKSPKTNQTIPKVSETNKNVKTDVIVETAPEKCHIAQSKKLPETSENLKAISADSNIVEKSSKTDETVEKEVEVSDAVEEPKNSDKSSTVSNGLQNDETNSEIDEKCFNSDLTSSFSVDLEPQAEIRSNSSENCNNENLDVLKTESVANNEESEMKACKNEFVDHKNSPEPYNDDYDDDESDDDGLCIDLKSEDVKGTESSPEKNETVSLNTNNLIVSSGVTDVSSESLSVGLDSATSAGTGCVSLNNAIASIDNAETKAENKVVNLFENSKESKLETESLMNANKLTLYGESDIPSVVTVKLICQSCQQSIKEHGSDAEPISYVVVKDGDCEICKSKVESTCKTSSEEEASSSKPISNVEKVIESVARNFSKDAENLKSLNSETPVDPLCESVLEKVLKTAGYANKSQLVTTSSSQDNVIIVKSNSNPAVTKSFLSNKNNIIIKDAGMKSVLTTASKSLKSSGTTYDGKLYKVIFLPKSSSMKTTVTNTVSAMKNSGEAVIKTSDSTTIKVVPVENSCSAVLSTASLPSFSATSASKLISLSGSCNSSVKEPTTVLSNSNLKRIFSAPVPISSAGIPTVPNRNVFSSVKSTTHTTFSIPSVSSTQPLKKPPLFSIIKSDGSKFKVTDKTSIVKSIINNKVSVLSPVTPSTSPEKSKFISLQDYFSHRSASSNITSTNASSPFLPPKPVLMRSLEPDKSSSSKLMHSVYVNRPSSLISIRNGIDKSGLLVSDEGSIPMSTTLCPKRPRLNDLKDENVSASYSSNFLDTDSKISILNSILLPPFTPTVPDSVYDANNPIAKFSCSQCPDTFISADYLQNHLNRRSVLMKYDCQLCPSNLVIVYNRCMLKQHCEKHRTPVNLKCLTIEPLPLALFDLNLFSTKTGESSNMTAINVPDTSFSKPRKPAKSRAKSKKRKLSSEEINPTVSSSISSAASAPTDDSVADTAATNDGENIASSSPSFEKNTPVKPAAEKKVDTLTYCGECQTTFPSLSAHLQDSGKPNAEFTCECHKVCASLCSLKAHSRLHSKKPPHSCPECGQSFLFASALEEHFKKSCYHPFKKNSYQCIKCNQNFSIIQKLEWHILRNHTRQVNICGICEISSPNSTLVHEHLNQNHRELMNHASYRILRFMECDFCPKTKFPRHQSRQHIQAHTKQKSSFTPNYYYHCEFCTVYKTINKIDFGQHLDYCLFSTSLRSLEELSKKDDLNLSETEQSTFGSGNGVETEHSSSDSLAPMVNGAEKTADECESSETLGERKSCETASERKACEIVGERKSSEIMDERKSSEIMDERKTSETDECQSSEIVDEAKSSGTVNDYKSTEIIETRNSQNSKSGSSETSQGLKKRTRINLKDHIIKPSEPSEETESTVAEISVLECKYCPGTFRSVKKFRIHLKSEHFEMISTKKVAVKRKKTAVSSLKQKVMKNTDGVQKPDSAEIENSAHECSKCNFIGGTYTDLFNHMETHKTIYECQECNESFVAHPSLEKHLIVTHQFDMKKAKSVVDAKSLSTEVVKEKGAYLSKQGFYQCATCYKNFTTEDSFNVHFRTHGLAFVTDSASPSTLVK